jgi:hypothetical protein
MAAISRVRALTDKPIQKTSIKLRNNLLPVIITLIKDY